MAVTLCSSAPLCSSLYFYCNRPTVAAIIAMGVDVGAAASAAFGSSEEAAAGGAAAAGDGAAAPAADGSEGQEGCQVEGEPAAVAQAASLAQGAAPVEEKVEQVSGTLCELGVRMGGLQTKQC